MAELETGRAAPQLAVDINDEMSKSFVDYAMSVIVSRALPDVRDGLKPVQRRIIYAMDDMGVGPRSSHRKSATVVGEVIGKYHPHSNDAIYDALVRMGQSFSLRYPLIHPQGNFGTTDDPPGGHALHRVQACSVGRGAARRYRRGHGGLRRQLRRIRAGTGRAAGPLPQPVGERLAGHRGRHGHQHPAPQPAGGHRRCLSGWRTRMPVPRNTCRSSRAPTSRPAAT